MMRALPASRSGRRALFVGILAAALLVAGVGAYAIALRPCRAELPPGRVLTYRLSTTIRELLPDGKDRLLATEERRLELIGLGPEDGRGALVVSAGGLPGIALVTLDQDGSLGSYDRAGHDSGRGVAIAGFDFSLLALPPGGADQEWKPEIAYAVLPPDRRAVACEAKRLRAGAKPEFRLAFPDSVEWLDPASGLYRQVRGLVATYRFDGLHHAAMEAQVRYTAKQELPPPGGERKLAVEHALTLLSNASADAVPARLAAAAEAAAAAQTWAQARRPVPAALAASLRDDPGLPPLLRGCLAGLQARAGR